MSDEEGPLADRVDALERRLAALEAPTPPAQPTVQPAEDDGDTFWALHGLQSRTATHSVVLFTGAVTRPDGARYEWQQCADVDDLLESDGWDTLAESLSALAHPARLNVLRGGSAAGTPRPRSAPSRGSAPAGSSTTIFAS